MVRFDSLRIINFRAIQALELDGLRDLVVIAGPNGCGKSAIFHAIRLLKSSYGGYDANEWSYWFSEFQLRLTQDNVELEPLFRDKSKPIIIEAVVTLTPAEIDYIRGNLASLIQPIATRQVTRRSARYPAPESLATEVRAYRNDIEKMVAAVATAIEAELDRGQFRIGLTLNPAGQPEPVQSHLAELIFQTYRPPHLGIISYHSDQRHYEREQLGGINLNLDSERDRARQSSLYNVAQKYGNIKSDLAAEYVRDLLAREAGLEDAAGGRQLRDSLNELFETFFPGKSFGGVFPNADGSVTFPVRLDTGHVHDINDLSSGEKEVLYGYLRLRSSAPQNSVVLIDEPELHLNPGLLHGLPDFYYEHVAQGLNNQLWLVTHSDTLLRQAVGHGNYSVYHMQTAAAAAGANQARMVSATTDLEQAIIDLVGDLATYVPDGKIVVLEGGGETEWDVHMVGRLFPEARARLNLLAGGSKRRVSDVWEVLHKASEEGAIRSGVFAIVDRDGEVRRASGEKVHQWDVYHIENYLLEPRFVLAAVEALTIATKFRDERAVYASLKDAARSTASEIVAHKLRVEANGIVNASFDFGGDPKRTDLATVLREAVERSAARFHEALAGPLSASSLSRKEDQLRGELVASLESDRWRTEFRGRDVLKRFAAEHLAGVPYQAFRNVVLDKMVAADFQPPGMKVVIDGILSS